MPDVVVRAPFVAAPDLVLYRDVVELDLWARAPYVGSPDLVAYGRGPVSDAIAVPGGTPGNATGSLPTISLVAPSGTASGEALATGALATITITTLTGTATGGTATSGVPVWMLAFEELMEDPFG